jgi:hypothetical protein
MIAGGLSGTGANLGRSVRTDLREHANASCARAVLTYLIALRQNILRYEQRGIDEVQI